MADIFESIGRTNALSEETGRLSELVMGMRQKEAVAKQQEVENIRAEKAQGSQLETNRLQQNLLSQQVQELEQKKRIKNTVVDISATGFMQARSPRLQQVLLRQLKEAGIVDVNNRGSIGDALDFVKATGESKEEYELRMAEVVDAHKKDWMEVHSQVTAIQQEAAAKGKDLSKDKNYQALLMQDKAANQKYQMATGTYSAHLNELEKAQQTQKAALELERVKAQTRGTNKPTALMKNAEYLKQSFPYMAPGDITAILTGQAIKADRKVKLREEAYRWSIEQGDSPEEARAYATQLDRELGRSSRFDQRDKSQGGVKQPPQGFNDTGRTSGGKRVYQGKDPQTGKEAYWVEE